MGSTIATQSHQHTGQRARPPSDISITSQSSRATFHVPVQDNTCHRDKYLTIAKYTHTFDAPGRTRNFINEVTQAVSANAYYSSLLLPDGSINYDAPPSSANRTLFHFLLEKFDAKSQTTFRSFDTKLGT